MVSEGLYSLVVGVLYVQKWIAMPLGEAKGA
jgi:uncharacterized membrane protein